MITILMVRIKLFVIGKVKESYIREAIADYAKRIGSYCQIECKEFLESTIPDDHPASVDGAKKNEGEKLCSGITQQDYVIALDRTGKTNTSEGLADIIKSCEVNGPYQIVFLIGGPHGLSVSCKNRADYILSMSAMTFPHQLARLLLYEQIYRAFTIIRGQPYHR
ncbi:23S rRNA (pseudouridine(1915)-N(3))-methyltransferase RlmH [Methanospirillum sp. J.3.6.1-F.2.7.3]|jgi:23S rRNA (pseudouridine1915-N3)-methyltransferase|uniref:Putative ribosomal RNA large subunit methyltransferase H n=2 Tax=Methanospirillum TaxID=2202 RepID=A0A8E7EJZ5_9EURY|nr:MULTISPECIES: 23S rRNA (pseudouridine(1915)-N(3))-methyltransferase RlmH [Methanospirillum]MDX8549739.1 23S rRNA (pseudouridine(1915)-N(3))-methyltransferase RlmH [Methanospirillum hungatei]NLW75846.1 23S rRNA (pseudouridine(1915)-N(3))-methyltransferase RlmH [Methanomicrobiales archaeon]QVV89624.1 23S rRNA (pseudouridine(1915)-N(3))-methyltransferase RlmH [Methanospirillum sp. J.3.6.1-F.2.7.3]QXO96086.1 23S rRNA (pseudouridine(1915)-N(3))-methyltransferase RlmH [Methanospirillum hungatei]